MHLKTPITKQTLLISLTGFHWIWTAIGIGLWQIFPGPAGTDIVLMPRPLSLMMHILLGLALCFFLWRHDGAPLKSRSNSLLLLLTLMLNLAYVCLYPLLPTLASNLFFYGSPVIGSLLLVRLWQRPTPSSPASISSPTLGQSTCFFLTATLLYTLSGVYFTQSVGEHAGDEGHYLTQARSLYEDGDLDIKNNIGKIGKRHPEYFHVAMTSKNEKWYSWHSPGLSFLLAPTMGQGLWFRHGVLGAIAASALLGMWILARQLGAREPYALSVVCLSGASVFWLVYASRALPETLGAALAVWATVAAIAQVRKPWRSLFPAAVCVVLLPLTQTRFIPLSLTLMGVYGLTGLLNRNELRPRKILRLGVFTLLCLGGYACFMWYQYQRYAGGSAYPVKTLLFSLPLGLWHSLASSRGIIAFFPMLLIALVALPLGGRSGQPTRRIWIPLLIFASIYFTSCATVWFAGGSCLPGRFLFSVSPVVLAYFAADLHRLPTGFRGLTAYTGLYAASFSLFMLPWLPAMGKSFSNPNKIDLIHPMITDLVTFYYDPMFATRLFPALGLMGVAALLLWRPSHDPKITPALCTLLAALFFIYPALFPFADGQNTHQSSALDVAEKLRDMPLQKAYLPPAYHQQTPSDIFAFSNRFHQNHRLVKGVTLEDLSMRMRDNLISLPRIENNDWQGRDRSWATLTSPFQEKPGTVALGVSGKMTGLCSGEFVIREGQETLFRQLLPPGENVQINAWLEPKACGDIYILLYLEGKQGSFMLDTIQWTPATDWMREDLSLGFSTP